VLDLEVALYSSLVGGSLVGTPIALADVPCSNGLFTVTLDFGAGAFDGNQRWLEIRVSPDFPSTSYTVLTPRQELTPTPYAIFATGATDALNATNAVNATNADDSDLLDGIDSLGFSLVGRSRVSASGRSSTAAPAVT
jgi:hypothetical protein